MQQEEEQQQHPTLPELLEAAQMDKSEYQQLKTLIKVLDLIPTWKQLPIPSQNEYLPQLITFVNSKISSNNNTEQVAYSRQLLSMKSDIEAKLMEVIKSEIQREYMVSLVMEYLEQNFQISSIEQEELSHILGHVITTAITIDGEEAGKMSNMEIEEYVKSRRKVMRAAFAEAHDLITTS
jgi:hypothetical protein